MTEVDVRHLICDKFLGGDRDWPLDSDASLLDDGICDSLGIVQIVVELERLLPGLRISDQDVTWQNFGSINAILAFLEQKHAE